MLLLWSTLEGMIDILSVQRKKKGSKTRFLVLRLSSFPITTWLELILWNSVVPHIAWIESDLLDFKSAFSFVWWISHVSIVTSFITWSILTNCLNLITRLLLQKTYFSNIKAGKGQYQCHRLIIMEDICHITKWCKNDWRTVKWTVKKIEHSYLFGLRHSIMLNKGKKLFPKA